MRFGRYALTPNILKGIFRLPACFISLAVVFTPAFAILPAGESVQVKISAPQSILEYRVQPQEILSPVGVPSVNFRIRGSVLASNTAVCPNVYVSINTQPLLLRQGTRSMSVLIGGTIGSVPVSVTPTHIIFNGLTAPIDLFGDLDERTLGFSTPSGRYRGSLVITAMTF